MFDSSSNKIKIYRNVDFRKSLIKRNIYENITNIIENLHYYSDLFIKRYGKYFSLKIIEFYPHNKFLPKFIIDKFNYKYNFFYIKGIEGNASLDLSEERLIVPLLRIPENNMTPHKKYKSSDNPNLTFKHVLINSSYSENLVFYNPQSTEGDEQKEAPGYGNIRNKKNQIYYEYDGIIMNNKAYVKKVNLYDDKYYPLMKKIEL